MQMNSHMKTYTGEALGVSESGIICPHGVGVHYSPSVDVFTNLEVLWARTTGMSMEPSLHESESEVAQGVTDSLWPHGLYLPGISVHGIFQARLLEWVAISCSRGSSQPRDQSQVSCIAGRLYCLSHKGSSSLHRHDQLIPFSASLPSLQKRGDGADKLLIMACLS